MVRITLPTSRFMAAGAYEGSQITMGASATSASAPAPLRTPATVPSGLNSSSSTFLFRMKMPPWIAHSREKPSGMLPRPYTG